MTVSIIGSDSFIASQFYNSSDRKENIKLFSRQSSGKQNEIIKDNLFQITEKDFIDTHIVLNFAAIVHQPKIKNQALYKKINTELPIYLANQAKKAGVKYFIQMSTIAVYGSTEYIDINSMENPITLYGESKYNADKILLDLQDNFFKVSIIRPPMVYGGGKAPGNMQKLIKFALKGIPLPFKGVKNIRDFIHVQNLILSLNQVIENKISGVVIPTDNKPVSTEEIINLIKKYSSSPVRQFRIHKFAHSIGEKLIPNIYKKVFGNLIVKCSLQKNIYKPQYNIETGIKEMIK